MSPNLTAPWEPRLPPTVEAGTTLQAIQWRRGVVGGGVNIHLPARPGVAPAGRQPHALTFIFHVLTF